MKRFKCPEASGEQVTIKNDGVHHRVCVCERVFTAMVHMHSKYVEGKVFISVSIEICALRVLYGNGSMHIYPCN